MGSLLHDPVADARDVQMPDPAGGLGNVHPARWRRMVHPLLQFPPKVGEEDCNAPFLDGLDGLAVDSGGTAIGSDSLPGALQDVRIGYPIVERVEPSRRARLGGPIQRPLELSSAGPCVSTGGVVSLIGIHPLLPPPGRMDKAGSLPSGALCCRRRHQYRMLPSDCLSANLPFALRLIGDRALAAALSPGGGGSPQFSHRPSHHSEPLTPRGSWALHSQALRAVRGLRPFLPGSAPLWSPLQGLALSTRQASLDVTDW